MVQSFSSGGPSAGSSNIARAALKGWTLLLSCCPTWRLDTAFCSNALQSMARHLEVNDVEERNAAGEAIALIFSMAGLALEDDVNTALETSPGMLPSSIVTSLSWLLFCPLSRWLA